MKHIRKRIENFHFLEQANKNPPIDSAQATSRWNSFNRTYKKRLREGLREEQYGLCAYSEINIEESGLGAHIEHVEPKSANPQRTFDYLNLVLSAFSSQDLSMHDSSNVFGGHSRKCDDVTKFISALQHDCSRYFVYTSDGHIAPAENLSKIEKQKAIYTIKELNLDCDYLIVERKKWLDELDEEINEHIKKGYSIEDLATIYLTPVNNKLYQFFSATYPRFGKFSEKVLAESIPELLLTV